MVALAFRIGRGTSEAEPGRLLWWRERAVGEQGSVRGLMTHALTAAVIEAGSMVPYLAAIGLIGASDLGWGSTLAILAGYGLVMVLPAMTLLAGRLGASGAVDPVLRKINDWMIRNGRDNTAWIVGIIGFLLTANALDGLGVLQQIDEWSKG